MECKHKFILVDVKYRRFWLPSSYRSGYELITVYFCENCLHEEYVIKKFMPKNSSEPTPKWVEYVDMKIREKGE